MTNSPEGTTEKGGDGQGIQGDRKKRACWSMRTPLGAGAVPNGEVGFLPLARPELRACTQKAIRTTQRATPQGFPVIKKLLSNRIIKPSPVLTIHWRPGQRPNRGPLIKDCIRKWRSFRWKEALRKPSGRAGPVGKASQRPEGGKEAKS